MSTPPQYSQETMAEHGAAWYDAAAAFRAGNHEGVANALALGEMPDDQYYPLLIAQTVLGVYLCAAVAAKRHGMAPLTPMPDGEWVVEALDPRREGSAAERFAAIAITTAANGDLDGVSRQVMAYASPSDRGLRRITQVMGQLVAILAALIEDDTAAGGGAS